MEKQRKIIKQFCDGANYYMVKFDTKTDDEFGKILDKDEIIDIDVHTNEIHRSIGYKDNDVLFTFSLLPKERTYNMNNPLQLLINNLKEASLIEDVYPDIFRWAYNGLNLVAYARIPSGDMKSNTTITRYGGTDTFIKILRQHLENITKMYKGMTPDFNFLNNDIKISDTELSIGSINKFTGLYSVGITPTMEYRKVIKNSKDNIQEWKDIKKLDMKYWAREINPDFIVEAKHIKLKETLPIDMEYKMYPPCIKNLMSLKTKGNYNRFLLATFLLGIHKPRDARFVFDSVLSDEEREHVKTGNCSTQWNFILNNLKRYSAPSCSQMKKFCVTGCEYGHPLEKAQNILNEEKEKEKNDD